MALAKIKALTADRARRGKPQFGTYAGIFPNNMPTLQQRITGI